MTTLAAPTVHRLSADLYRVRVGLEWADVYLWGEGGRRGSLTIQSTLGTYAYTWSNIGHQKSFREFLAGLDFTYFMEKTRGDYLVFDPVATARAIADDLLQAWRAGEEGFPGELALDCLDRLEEERLWEIADAGVFHLKLDATGISGTLYQHDLTGLARRRPLGECVTFWAAIWPVICAAWRREAQCGEREAVPEAVVIERPGPRPGY